MKEENESMGGGSRQHARRLQSRWPWWHEQHARKSWELWRQPKFWKRHGQPHGRDLSWRYGTWWSSRRLRWSHGWYARHGYGYGMGIPNMMMGGPQGMMGRGGFGSEGQY